MNSFIESQFSYCPLVWMFCSRGTDRKINHIHERALRMVYLDYTTSFTDLLKKDGSVTIHHRNIRLVAKEMFRVKHDICPEIIKSLFYFNNNQNVKKDFLRPNVKSEYKGKLSLRYFGPVVWDYMLPENLKTITTFEKFKTEIKKWVPENCPCRLCKTYIPQLGFVNVCNWNSLVRLVMHQCILDVVLLRIFLNMGNLWMWVFSLSVLPV